ncbi:hypothetical protein Pcinc_006473 [Petrolisthes cinctipes]|uniref:Major facilitator superfamily (MFS) profile domain-containing protein n=1 Tax=Petrolisthes cinctipes TaxID=88211 RepID=A0AAE1GCY2_PETCI|nr:hypothetical protein Pcinc_006473 [Petrolisthes cinctipes]
MAWSGEARKDWHEDKHVAMMGQSSLTEVEDQDHHHHHQRPKEWWGARHTLALMGFLGFSVIYAMRVNLSVAIVAMVKGDPNATHANNNNDNNSDVCPFPDDYDPQQDANVDGEFTWDEKVQGQILGCFYFGYLFTNILAGRLSEHLGGRTVFGLGLLLTAFLTLLAPICARISSGLFIAVRVMTGAMEGVTFPAMNVMLATWVPALERAKFSSLVYSGCQFGSVITLMSSGWLCDSDILGGWPSVFYVFGALGVPVPVPWKAVFTSLPIWSLMVVHFGQNWGFYTLLTELPTYLSNIQHYDITSSGFLSALPYLVMWVFSLVFSALIDRLLAANKLSIIAVRKMSMVIGLYGPMLGLVAMCFVNCDSILAMVMLCVAVGLNGAIYCGYMCSHQDLAPNFAGSLMGLTNTVATIPPMVSPMIIGAIINDNQTLSAWRTVFLIASAVYLVTNIGYLAFMTDQVQPWNFPTSRKNTSTSYDHNNTGENDAVDQNTDKKVRY